MNNVHLNDSHLQQIAIDKVNLPATVMGHYKNCITCQQAAEKYMFLLDHLAQEQRPVLSTQAMHMILAGLPLLPRNKKNYWHLLMVCVGILVSLSILLYLLKEFRKELPAIASCGALLIVAIIVVHEFIERFNKYQKKIEAFATR